MEERHQMFVCVAASMLLLPYLNFGPLVNYTFYLLYTLMLVPMLVSYISPSYAITFISAIFHIIWSVISSFTGVLRWVFEQQLSPLQGTFPIYRIQNVTGEAMVCLMSEKWLCQDTHHLHWAQSFFVCKLVMKLGYALIRTSSAPGALWQSGCGARHVAARLGPPASVLAAIVFVLYAHICFISATCSCAYSVVIFSYLFFESETFLQLLTDGTQWLRLDYLEGLEKYYCAAAVRVALIVIAAVLFVAMLLQRNVGLAFLCVTTNVYISYRDLLHNVYRGLQEEMCKLARFRKATQHELATLEDVCAVCLLPMRSARVTPCKHIFHGGCLLPCLKQKRTCPLCNQQIC